MINPFLFALVALGMALVVVVPPIAALVLIHRFTYRSTAYWLWLVGSLVYVAAMAVMLTKVTYESGLLEWAKS